LDASAFLSEDTAMLEPRIYNGVRNKKVGSTIFRDGVPIPLSVSLKVRAHSPDGFEWGYGGSGPAQTALAILLDLFAKDVAASLYQQFKFDVISKIKEDTWTLRASEIVLWVSARLQESEQDNPLLRD
jgi:Family of unknown function (DUF6166)